RRKPGVRLRMPLTKNPFQPFKEQFHIATYPPPPWEQEAKLYFDSEFIVYQLGVNPGDKVHGFLDQGQMVVWFDLTRPLMPQLENVNKLEPISKSPEEDNEAGELYEAEEVLGVVFPTDEDAALPLNPSKEALHEPASHIAAQPSPILRGRLASVAAMRRDHLDAVLAQLLSEWIAFVGAIANQILRLGLDHVEVEA